MEKTDKITKYGNSYFLQCIYIYTFIEIFAHVETLNLFSTEILAFLLMQGSPQWDNLSIKSLDLPS